MSHDKTKSDNDTSTSRSAKAQKADEVQAAHSAKAGAGHDDVPEGGKAASPLHHKGEPMPARSKAELEGTGAQGTSAATAGKAEKQAAHAVAEAKPHGRGFRKE